MNKNMADSLENSVSNDNVPCSSQSKGYLEKQDNEQLRQKQPSLAQCINSFTNKSQADQKIKEDAYLCSSQDGSR